MILEKNEGSNFGKILLVQTKKKRFFCEKLGKWLVLFELRSFGGFERCSAATASHSVGILNFEARIMQGI